MVFHIIFMLALFHDKKYCNWINLFFCILWDLIVIGLILSGEDLLKKLISRLGLWVVRKLTWGAHVRSWRVSVFRNSSRNLAKSQDDPWNALVKCGSYTLHTYYIYHHYPQNCKETIPTKVSTTLILLERAAHPQERNHCSFCSSPITLLYLERRFVSKYNPHIFKV